MKNKLLLTGLAACMLSGASAYAGDFNVDLNIGGGGEPSGSVAYVAPAPVYVQPVPAYYDPHHSAGDWRYWQEKRDREAWEHEHRGQRWDHNRWAHDHAHDHDHDNHWDHR